MRAPTMIRTDFTDAFDVASPILGAPMDGASYAELAAAVATAGGLGMVACGIMIPVSEIQEYVCIVIPLRCLSLCHKSLLSIP
jgi:NAD(P)H-dependent flavin oxidoreductase YrpB (nitropropane dioxygenase family)